MSASLVGSEMCIRDSRCPRGQGCRLGGCTRGNSHRRGAGHCWRAVCRACLLYTSDAADDM
eukprot:12498630-Alexandrium_andersonii.AAC.1